MKTNRYICYLTFWLFVGGFFACSDSETQDVFDENPALSGPVIDTMSPNSAYNGDTVIIKGRNFSTDTSITEVSFTGSIAKIVSATETELKVIVPLEANSSSGTVFVTVNGEQAMTDFGFEVLQPPFDLYSMNPREGSAGQIIRINGTDLPEESTSIKVFFGEGVSGEVVKLTTTYFDVLVPYGGTSGRFTLEIDGYLALSPNSFTYVDGGTWERLGAYSDPPTGGVSGFVIDGQIYVGLGRQYGYVKSFYRFDPGVNAFDTVATFPGAGRGGAFTFSYDGKGYVGSGFLGFENYVSDVYQYDPQVDEWTRMADFPGEPRNQAVSFVLGDKGYVGLGSGGGKDFWEYDFALDQWTQIEDFPGASRQGAGSFVIDTKAFVYGGLGNGVYNDLWEFDPASGNWRQLANSNTEGQANMIAFSIGGKGYMACGWDYEGNAPTSKMRQTHEYDPATDSWRRISNFYDGGISYSLSLVSGGRAYVFSGEYNSNYYAFTPD